MTRCKVFEFNWSGANHLAQQPLEKVINDFFATIPTATLKDVKLHSDGKGDILLMIFYESK